MSIERYCSIFTTNIAREGSLELLDWIKSTDFFTAPASTKHHGAYEGGLCVHSLNVYDELVALKAMYPQINPSDETVAVVALLHDLCKVDCYRPGTRNVQDKNGKWQKIPCYNFDEQFSYGNHGGKSVFLASKFLKLSDEEAVAIQCHMGNEDGKYTTSSAFGQFPLAWLLHVADEAATYLDEKQ
ncbi:MAG: hypothetical protein RR365_10830 [Bacteroides sp.]